MSILELPTAKASPLAPCVDCGAPSRWLDAAGNRHCDICDPPAHRLFVAGRELLVDDGGGLAWLPWTEPRVAADVPPAMPWDCFEPDSPPPPGWKFAAGETPGTGRQQCSCRRSNDAMPKGDLKPLSGLGRVRSDVVASEGMWESTHIELREPCRGGEWVRIYCSECRKTIRIDDSI